MEISNEFAVLIVDALQRHLDGVKGVIQMLEDAGLESMETASQEIAIVKLVAKRDKLIACINQIKEGK